MENLFTGIQRVVAGWGPESEAALKRARNKERFRAAVERTWKMRPDVARFILMHTNGIYLAEDTRPRRGPDRDREWWVFGVYLDDTKARAEVDTWQAKLLECLKMEGFSIDELRFFPAKWDMRRRKLFPELWEEGAEEVVAGGDGFSYRDESRALDIVKKAVYLVFEDTEQAWALLEKVQGAAVREVITERLEEEPSPSGRRRATVRTYRLFLYVEDVAEMRRLMKAFGRAIRSRCFRLGLRISSIWVYQAPPSLAGRHAFQRAGASVPLRDDGVLRETGTAGAAASEHAREAQVESVTAGFADGEEEGNA